MPVNFLPMHPFDNGEMIVRDEQTLPWPRTQQNVGGKLARYYASIEYYDAQVGRVIEALKQANQYENTIFIVASDNGLSLGEHGLIGKQNIYESGGMQVPLLFAGPGIKQGETAALTYLYDVYPTMCQLAGIPVPEGLDAKHIRVSPDPLGVVWVFCGNASQVCSQGGCHFFDQLGPLVDERGVDLHQGRAGGDFLAGVLD